MTLLERMAEAAATEANLWNPNDDNRMVAIASMRAALRTILTPTPAMASRGGLKAFSGPQVEGEPLRVYPALIWREMVSYVLEERDREPEPEPDEESADG